MSPGWTIRPPGCSRGRRVVCLRSGLRPSLRHTTQTLVPQLSHEHWYRNRGGVKADHDGQAMVVETCLVRDGFTNIERGDTTFARAG